MSRSEWAYRRFNGGGENQGHNVGGKDNSKPWCWKLLPTEERERDIEFGAEGGI